MTGRFCSARLAFCFLAMLSVVMVRADDPAPAAKQPAAEKPKHRNRLADETSPYLLLHAHNPVNWYPWGEEALAKAKKEKKLIFLSIGYSSCHWCHVMERESFLDDEIAALLNKHYVCIKVDREERPEIDSIYMTSLQVYMQLAGQGRGGGWPLSMFLTPEGEPFFGGTYFPARTGDRGRSTGFLTIIEKVQDVWTTDAEKVREDAKTLSSFVKRELEQQPVALAPVKAETLDAIHTALWERFDQKHGGFGFREDANTPKFPEPPNLVYLLDRLNRKAGKKEMQVQAREMLITTLDHMAAGGVYDHVGGGFHRYTVDRQWQIPHFEKMLYDNGQLASVYADAFALTGREDYRRIVVETLAFVDREMSSPEGGFYAALDAESEHEEGKFYRWEKDEVKSLLTADEFALASKVYGLAGEPNFEEKYYCLQFDRSWPQVVADSKLSDTELMKKLAPIRQKLLAARNKRPRPLTDDKILTATNGLMIKGFADAGRVLKNKDYVARAAKAADFVLAKLRTKEGRLLRTHAKGQAKFNGYLEDYSFLIDALLALHTASGEERWLKSADELCAKQIELFADARHGGFFFTSRDHETLLARAKDFSDNAQPSANTVSAMNLLLLSDRMKKPAYREEANRTIQAGGALMQRSPILAPQLGVAAARVVK
jgi:uncharacterized protein YyaL (SSP411 family)